MFAQVKFFHGYPSDYIRKLLVWLLWLMILSRGHGQTYTTAGIKNCCIFKNLMEKFNLTNNQFLAFFEILLLVIPLWFIK